MPNTDRIQVADWLYDDLVELQRDPVFVAEDIVLDMAEQISDALTERGMTQKDLADELGISPSAVSQLLKGDQNVSILRFVRVALALDKSVKAPELVPFEMMNLQPVEPHRASFDLTPTARPAPSPSSTASTRRLEAWAGRAAAGMARGTFAPSRPPEEPAPAPAAKTASENATRRLSEAA